MMLQDRNLHLIFILGELSQISKLMALVSSFLAWQSGFEAGSAHCAAQSC